MNPSLELKLIYAGISSLLTLVAFAPYIWTIYRGQTRPHAFSWIIWGVTTFIVFLAQLKSEGGAAKRGIQHPSVSAHKDKCPTIFPDIFICSPSEYHR